MNKSAAKQAYKEAKRLMGVYRISSAQGDKVFLGCASDMPARINRHKAELKFGNHRNRELQQVWNLLGESGFDFLVLDVLEHREDKPINPAVELPVLLEMWIRKLENEGYCVATL